MLKRLLVIAKISAGVVLIVAAVVFVTYEEHRARDKYQRECQKNIPVVAVSAENTTCGPDKCTDPKEYLPWWYVLVAWPEGIATWAVMFTLGAIVWQSYETRKAADAALLNSQAIVNSERAWLVAEPVRDERLPFFWQIKITNHGRTPAWFIRGDAKYILVERPDLLPSRQSTMLQSMYRDRPSS